MRPNKWELEFAEEFRQFLKQHGVELYKSDSGCGDVYYTFYGKRIYKSIDAMLKIMEKLAKGDK